LIEGENVAKKSSQVCKCVEQVNAKLESVGAEIVQHMQINFDTKKADMSGPCVEVRRSDKAKRGKIPVVLCAFCPFCGTSQQK